MRKVHHRAASGARGGVATRAAREYPRARLASGLGDAASEHQLEPRVDAELLVSAAAARVDVASCVRKRDHRAGRSQLPRDQCKVDDVL